MEKTVEKDKILLPHHVQHELCSTRLPYRQGRKLTAVKVYSIAKESKHLLIFGVPSLNLRQETKLLFVKFGKLLQFNISKEHASESFTETYHAQYERIQSARQAKRVIDTKNFYGGVLHVCYAPELESITETRQKITQRRNDVLRRVIKLKEEDEKNKINKLLGENEKDLQANVTNDSSTYVNETYNIDKSALYMGEENLIRIGPVKRNKRLKNNVVIEKKFKPCFVNHDDSIKVTEEKLASSNVTRNISDVTEVEIVDCTSTEKTTISNINEALNYSKFGQETVFKVSNKPVNKIKFNMNKKSLVCKMFYFKTFIKYSSDDFNNLIILPFVTKRYMSQKVPYNYFVT